MSDDLATTLPPVLLPANQFPHFYRGGDRIGALRGGPGGPMRPEEWIGSTVTRFGEELSGLSELPDGRLLRDAVADDPQAWLGPEHLDAFGQSSELLVKLLDPDQRLPVHFHPDKAFARRHLALDHGKTEAWIVLEAPPGAGVGLGFADAMAKDQVLGMVERRESAGLLASLRRREVTAGMRPSRCPAEPGSGLCRTTNAPTKVNERPSSPLCRFSRWTPARKPSATTTAAAAAVGQAKRPVSVMARWLHLTECGAGARPRGPASNPSAPCRRWPRRCSARTVGPPRSRSRSDWSDAAW